MFKRIIKFLIPMFLALFSTLGLSAQVREWNVSKPLAVRASILYEGLKGSLTSSVLITPNTSQVANVLKNGGGGFALAYAVKQLLGAVDWVLDPANNQIRYKVPPNAENCTAYSCEDPSIRYFYVVFNAYGLTPEQACLNSGGTWDKTNSLPCLSSDKKYIAQPLRYDNRKYSPQEKTLSLETVAQKIIENAQNNNLDAQFAILAATDAILAEAEKDDAKAKPIAEELENNSKKCPNGQSRNAYGQCFICGSSALEQQMANDVQIAKGAHISLGACKATHTIEELTLRYNNYVREAVARDKLNACYDIPHQTHLNQAKEAWRQAQEVCVKYMAVK